VRSGSACPLIGGCFFSIKAAPTACKILKSFSKCAAKRLPTPGRAFDVELRLVPAQRMLDDGQAQPGASRVARAATVDPVKTFGQAGNVFGVDADAAVLHGEFRPLRVGMPADPDRAAGRRVAHGVGDQVAESADQFRLRTAQIARPSVSTTMV
jgi:hypothetical protein